MNRGGWFLISTITVTRALALGAIPASLVSAQSVGISPRVALMDAQPVAGSLGLRIELGFPRGGAYADIAAFGVGQVCELSLPPSCTHPSSGGTLVGAGIRLAFPDLGGIYPVASAGAGALLWADDEPYDSHTGLVLDLEIGGRLTAFSWADVTLGAKVQSISQSVSGGMGLTAERVTYPGIVVGLVVPLRK